MEENTKHAGTSTSSTCQLNEDECLEKLARKKLVDEAKRAANRAEIVGAQGWLKPKLFSTNKRFLKRTLMASLVPKKKVTTMSKNDDDKRRDRRQK